MRRTLGAFGSATMVPTGATLSQMYPRTSLVVSGAGQNSHAEERDQKRERRIRRPETRRDAVCYAYCGSGTLWP